MQSSENTESTAEPHAVVVADVNLADLKKRYDLYAKIKRELLTKNDYYKVKNKDGKEMDAIRKSGWFKFAVAFQISIDILDEERVTDESTGYTAFHFKVRARAGMRSTEDVGSCDNNEPNKKGATMHEIRAMAKTRATERAIILMVGADDVAAEDYENSTEPVPENKPTQSEVCHCPFDVIKEEKGKCTICGKPLTVGQLNTLAKIGADKA